MIIGERMNEGALLYVGVWDNIGPLSAWVYRLIDFAFGRSQLALQIIGLIVFFFQIFYMNYVALRHKMFNENNYVPALFYGIFGLILFDIITLSPQMLGLTFVLLSVNHLFNHVESRNKTDSNLLNIGLYTGIASLFYLPYLTIIFVHIVGLIFFTNTIRRRYLLLIYGVSIPLVICWLIYVWYDGANNLFENFFHSLFTINTTKFLSFKSISILGGSSILLFLLASIKTLSGFGYTIFQVRIQKVMFFAAMVTLCVFILYSSKDGYSLIMFFPWVAFFFTHFFLKIRNPLKRELGFLVYFLTIIIMYFSVTYKLFNVDTLINYDTILIELNNEEEAYSGAKTLILGPDIQPYSFSKQATPYFNWELSRKQLENLNYYDNLQEINKNIRSDMPEFIIDQVGLAPKLFDQIPMIGSEYELISKGVYKRIASSN